MTPNFFSIAIINNILSKMFLDIESNAFPESKETRYFLWNIQNIEYLGSGT